MNELQVVERAQFHSIPCDFWSNENEEVFMTSEQLGQALGYLNPRNSISNLVRRHEHLKAEEFSTVINLVTDRGKKLTRVFTEDGIYEVTILANTERALEFRSWIRQIVKGLRKGQLQINKKQETAFPLIYEEVAVLKESVDRNQKQLQHLTYRVDEQMTIDYGKQSKVQFAIKSRVLELLGGKESMNYREHRAKYFAGIYSDIKKKMGVCSYKDIRLKDYEEALIFIKYWIPDFHDRTA